MREEGGEGEEGAGRGGGERDVGERRLILNINSEEIRDYENIEILRGCDGISEFPKEDLYDCNNQDEDAISDGDVEMPTLEELVMGEETSGDEEIILEEEMDMIAPSQLREFVFEDEEVVLMEGGGGRSGLPEDEDDIWEYVREEALGEEESPVLGVTGFDRVIWARGTPINMVRVRLTVERLEREREERRAMEEERIRREREERGAMEERNFWAEDQSLLVIDEDGLRVISNNRRVLRNEINGVLGTFVDDLILERRDGGIIGREGESGEEERAEMGGAGGGEGRNGGVIVYPTPIEVIGVSGTRCHLFDAGGLNVNGLRVEALVREREEISRGRGEVRASSGSECEDDSGAERDLPSSDEN